MSGPNTSSDHSAPTFNEVFDGVADVQGWMTRAQAGRLWDAACRLEAGDSIVEIGSFHGRSAIVLASAAPKGVVMTTIDPHAGNDRGPQEIEGYVDEAEADHQQFRANLRRAGVDDLITHLREFSHDAHSGVNGEITLLYIDGAHRFGPARDDIVSWGRRVSTGGTLLVHDSFSSIGVTLALLVTTMVNGRFLYVGRSGSLAEFRRVDLSVGQRVANLVGHLAQLPWFVRNVVVKVLISAKLGKLARLLGSDGKTWPY
jgi:predicted O-methyltransferase YrrM